MIIKFTPEAVTDFEAGLEYYAKTSSEVQNRFVARLDETITIIARHPLICPKAKGEVRRYILRDFPYVIYYSIEDAETLVVLAILHVKRNPDTTDERLG